MLDAALAWAARGFRVFPLAAGTKDQPIVPFVEAATTDPATIRAWWSDPVMGFERDYNIGVETSALNVVDIDVRNGKPGLQNFLDLVGGFDTLTVSTPSGGYHCYFVGPPAANKVGNGKNGWPLGVDIRSHHGYVVGPGSFTVASENSVEGFYSVLIDGRPEDTPDTVKALLRPPLLRPATVRASEEDTAGAITAATAYLAGPAPPAIGGQGGDHTTYVVSCRLRDFGLSEEMAYRLLLQVWNGRCDPAWDAYELRAKVTNAYAYATGDPGAIAPEKLFNGFSLAALPPAIAPFNSDGIFLFGNATEIAGIGPRRWLYNKILMRGEVTLVGAPGGTGKSSLSLTIAAHLAMGLAFMDFKLHLRPGEDGGYSVIYNAEDDIMEMSRRLVAICRHYGFDYSRVKSRIALVDRKKIRLKLTQGRPAKVNVDHVQALTRAAMSQGVGAVFLDPLVSLHQSDELDNTEMEFVMDTLKAVAEAADVAVMAIHHTNKPSGASSAGRAGDMNSIRGATALVTPARAAYTLYAAAEADCEEWGIPPDNRDLYVRLDSAKANLARRGVTPRWLKAHSVKVGGDDVGVFAPVDLTAESKEASMLLARALIAEMTARSQGWMKLGDAVKWIRETDPLYAKVPEKALRSRLETWFAFGVTTGVGTLSIKQAEGGTGKVLTIE
jgi:hypothetical protein